MTTHRIKLPDWRNNVNGLPLAAFDGSSINRISKGKDAIAQRAVEHVAADDRPQTPNRFRSEP
jgi:hypothetical protein